MTDSQPRSSSLSSGRLPWSTSGKYDCTPITSRASQNDTRSTGLNVYSLSARSVAPDRLVVEVVNLTPIRFTLATMFKRQALRSVHFIDRLEKGLWGYYAITAVQAGAVDGQEKSFINRANAYYRYLIGKLPDSEPPLAP